MITWIYEKLAHALRRYHYRRFDRAIRFAYDKGWIDSAQMHAIDHLFKYERRYPEQWWEARGRVLAPPARPEDARGR